MPHPIIYARLAKSEARIRATLDSYGTRVFSYSEIGQLFNQHGQVWGMPNTVSVNQLIERFIQHGIFQTARIKLLNEQDHTSNRKVELLLYQEPSVYEIAASLNPNSYLSHFPAMFINGLTSQVPKSIYVTIEQSAKRAAPGILSQQGIDHAFSLPQRRSETIGAYGDFNFVLLKGKHTQKLGVVMREYGGGRLAVTALERTLIDIMVRPNYAGGAFMVLAAYQRAIQEGLSINKLMATLQNISYVYPYQQAVGFYLERAGYSGKFLDELLAQRTQFDFYLDYQIEEKVLDPKWKIYYPKGM